MRTNLTAAPAGAARTTAAAAARRARSSARDFRVIGTTPAKRELGPSCASWPRSSLGDMSGQATIPGTGEFAGTLEIRHVIFRAEDDGFALIEAADTETGDEFTLVGPVGHLNEGENA